MSETPSVPEHAPEKPKQEAVAQKEPPFGVTEMRLTFKQWLTTAGIVLVAAALLPRVWKHVEKFVHMTLTIRIVKQEAFIHLFPRF